MKKIKYSISVLILLLFATILVPSCVDDNVEGDAFYTFTGETVASYCSNLQLIFFRQIIIGNFFRLEIFLKSRIRRHETSEMSVTGQ